MLAEMEISQESISNADIASDFIRLEGRVFPFSTFCFINETTALLLNMFEHDPLMLQIHSETVSSLIHDQNKFLGLSLSEMSVDALMYWVCASSCIKCYMWSQEDGERLNAIDRLFKIRALLNLDDLFGKWQEVGAQDQIDYANDLVKELQKI